MSRTSKALWSLSGCVRGTLPISSGGAKRGQRHLKGNPHLTDGFAVELMTVEVRSDGHGKAAKAPPITFRFHITKIRIVKWARRRNQQTRPAFAPCGNSARCCLMLVPRVALENREALARPRSR